MKVKIWGARGSIPSPLKPVEIEEKICQAIYQLPKDLDTGDRATVQAYVAELPPLLRGTAGGNTACVEIQIGGEIFIIDAGSGLRELGLHLMKGPCGQGQGVLHLFFSHAHWDHIQGFPFFVPAFIPGNQIFIYSVHDLEAVLNDQQQSLNFPVPLSYMKATLKFERLEVGKPFALGKARINTLENAHPGKAYSFRFEDAHSVFVYASDSEYKNLSDPSVAAHVKFFKGADALIFDAQYTLREGWQKEDWGHSSAMIGVDLARAAGVKKLLLFHHDPTYSDSQLQDIQKNAVAYQEQDPTRPTCEVVIAYEGLTLDLTPRDAVEWHFMPDQDTAVLTPATIFDEWGVTELVKLVEQGSPSSSIIDLSQVENLTTATLKVLVTLRQKQSGGQIILANPSSKVQEIIKLSGYSDFFAIYSSLEAAVAAVQAREALNLPGQIIKGRYRVEGRVGLGRPDAYLRATDTETDRPVVVKILDYYYSQEAIERFMRQAEQLVNLRHPSIAEVIEVGQEGEFSFVVEEYIEGPSLGETLANDPGLISPDQALDIALDLTLTLEHIHSRGITHGDLQPRNIYITDEGIKLSDIGSGHLEEGRDLLDTPSLHLTAAYLAPEQILGHKIDVRTDLYSLGVILYQLFTGQLPFQGSDREIMHGHLYQPPCLPREINPNVSRPLEHLILKLLVKNPNARYASAEQARRVSSSLVVNVGEPKHQLKGPLVGRESQLRDLQLIWSEAQMGRGQLVFITGEPGIGKTRLAQQVSTQIKPPILLIGRCQEPEGSPTYYPFTEALRTYFATVPPEFFDEGVRHLLGSFTRLVPEIRQLIPNLVEPAPLEPKQEQLRLMSSVTQFIKQATEERAWLLILDDLQWADQSSLELLRYLGHHLPSMRLMIMGTYRDNELERSHPLWETLRNLSRYPTYHHFPLNRLDQNETDRVLTYIWKQPAPPALKEKIYQHTQGNPFYVEEVAKALVDDGLIILQGGSSHFPTLEDVRLPKSVREAVWRRIHYLSPDTQALLRQAAVLGQTFKFDDLREMSGLSEWEVLEHLDVALERGLLHEAPGENLLCFSHAEIQHVLYSDMGSLRRRMLHHQAGKALERYVPPESERIVEELAYHFGEAQEFERALVYSIQAARQAQTAYANEAALLWYNRTLAMLKQLTPEEMVTFEPMRLSVHRCLGEVLSLVGRYDEALAHYGLAMAKLENETPDQDQLRQLADLCGKTAEIYEKRSEYELCFDWIEKGLAYLGDDKLTTEAANLYLIGARAFDHQGKSSKAIDWCQTSLAIAAQIKTQEGEQTMAEAYSRLASICLLRGYFDLVVHFCRESVQIYQKIEDKAGQVMPYINLGIAYFYQGDWTEASNVYNKSLHIAQEVGNVDGQSLVSLRLADVYLGRGEWNRAADTYRQCYNSWKQIGAAKHEAKALSNLAQVYIYQENWSEAYDCLTRSQTILIGVDSDEHTAELEYRWADFYLRTGEFDQALIYVRRSIDLAAEQANPLDEGRAYRLLGQIYLDRGEMESARTALQRSMQVLHDLHTPYEMAQVKLLMARLTYGAGDSDKSEAYLAQASQSFEELGAQADLTQARALKQQLLKSF